MNFWHLCKILQNEIRDSHTRCVLQCKIYSTTWQHGRVCVGWNKLIFDTKSIAGQYLPLAKNLLQHWVEDTVVKSGRVGGILGQVRITGRLNRFSPVCRGACISKLALERVDITSCWFIGIVPLLMVDVCLQFNLCNNLSKTHQMKCKIIPSYVLYHQSLNLHWPLIFTTQDLNLFFINGKFVCF